MSLLIITFTFCYNMTFGTGFVQILKTLKSSGKLTGLKVLKKIAIAQKLLERSWNLLNWSAHTAFFSNHESQNAKFFYKLKLSLKKNIVLVCNIWQLLQTGLFPLLEQVHDLVVTSVFF